MVQQKAKWAKTLLNALSSLQRVWDSGEDTGKKLAPLDFQFHNSKYT